MTAKQIQRIVMRLCRNMCTTREHASTHNNPFIHACLHTHTHVHYASPPLPVDCNSLDTKGYPERTHTHSPNLLPTKV